MRSNRKGNKYLTYVPIFDLIAWVVRGCRARFLNFQEPRDLGIFKRTIRATNNSQINRFPRPRFVSRRKTTQSRTIYVLFVNLVRIFVRARFFFFPFFVPIFNSSNVLFPPLQSRFIAYLSRAVREYYALYLAIISHFCELRFKYLNI